MIADEKYDFKPATKRNILILGVVGIVLLIAGILIARSSSGHGEAKEKHAAAAISKELTASVAQEQHENHEAAAPAHEETPTWIKRVKTSLWANDIFFVGIGIIGLFFVAIQYAAQAGWSAGINRIPLAIGSWIPVAGLLTLLLWFGVKGDLFHWTHTELFVKDSGHFDKVINGKAGFFYWPLSGASGFPIFFIVRMIVFFGMWYLFYLWIKKEMLAEDIDGSTEHWYNARRLSAFFLVFFAVSSSVAAWDWMMSIDTHWFSTMFGWYTFASWWVTGLSMITLIVVNLKDAGYLKVVNSNHLHDLGKFIFAFSIFWAYLWFDQFLLIYYANIPEETVYFIARMKTAPYSWVFYANLFLNFAFPFLLLMTRDAKRHISMLKVVCPIVIVGHWIDHYQMVTPGVMHEHGGLGFIEIGIGLIFTAAFLYVVLTALSKLQLVAKHHPFMEESMHHHI